MPGTSYASLDWLFHPRSIALAGVTVNNPEHWTRTFLNGLLEFKFSPLYLVNPNGNSINGLKVYPSLEAVPDTIDYVISTVPARVGPQLIEECARKGVKAVHFCTAGFAETSEEEGIKLQARLVELSQKTGIRLIGPNCMGMYCPESRVAYASHFPKDSGTVALISQSGGHCTFTITQTMSRGVRFSKAVSYGNACDLTESDFIEYLTEDPDTTIIALYIEGIKDGARFRKAIEKATMEKTVILLKGGVTEGGGRAAAGHTGSLAGKSAAWDALCKQYNIIRARSLDNLIDLLVTCDRFSPPPKGRRAAVISYGGGASVVLADELERSGIEVPPLPREIRRQIREYTAVAGNILGNPLDCSQVTDMQETFQTVSILSRWDDIDFLIGFLNLPQSPPSTRMQADAILDAMRNGARTGSKPMAVILVPGTLPADAEVIFRCTQKCVASGLTAYYSIGSVAKAISQVLAHNERKNSAIRQM